MNRFNKINSAFTELKTMVSYDESGNISGINADGYHKKT